MTTIPELAHQLTEEAAETLIAVAAATPVERLTWKPFDNGRSILEQLAECSVANRKWAAILRSGAYANVPEDVYESAATGASTLQGAIAQLREATTDLLSAIEGTSVDRLAVEIGTPWGPYSIARGCLHAYWNMTYHEGQINYVQTLYGDFEEHEIPTAS